MIHVAPFHWTGRLNGRSKVRTYQSSLIPRTGSGQLSRSGGEEINRVNESTKVFVNEEPNLPIRYILNPSAILHRWLSRPLSGANRDAI
jgi:hypothetical protein